MKVLFQKTSSTPGGSNTQIQYNNAGTFGGVSTMTFDGTSVTLAGRLINSYTSVASSPAKVFTGTWFTGGTSTTTKPHFLIEPSGATSTAWSTSGTGLGVNAASGFAGNLLDLQVNGTSRIAIDSSGFFRSASEIGSKSPSGNWAGFTASTFVVKSITGSNNQVGLDSFSFYMQSSGAVQWNSSTTNCFSSGDLFLLRDAANTLAQRNGTNAQTYRIYNTFTDASNYERLSTTWSSNVCYTKPENAGTGSARLYVPVTGSTTVASLPSASTAGAGARAFVTDATATTFLSTVAGGGANKVPVVSDGTNWLIG